MKNTMNVIVVALFLLTSFTSQATEVTKNPKSSTPANSFVLKESGDIVLFNLLNLDLNPVKVEVKDDLGRIVFVETISNEKSIHKAYNFEKAFAGTYTVTVKDGKKNYTEKIIVS